MECLKPCPSLLQSRSVPFIRPFTCNVRVPCNTRNSIRQSTRVLASSSQKDTSVIQLIDSMGIENMQEDFCDDFVCTSSPAVEQTVRQLARDIQKLKFNTNYFQPDAQYSDGFRSFKGSEKYRSAFWPRAALKDPKATITKMAMIDSGKAQIDWQLAGQLSAFSVSIPMTSVFELNLVTGRVTSHTDSWDLSKLSPPAAAAVAGSRALWSAQAASKDATDNISKTVTESLSTLTSMDDEDEYYMNPNDPTKFFQKQDNGMNDAIMLALGVAGLYLVFKVFEQLESL